MIKYHESGYLCGISSIHMGKVIWKWRILVPAYPSVAKTPNGDRCHTIKVMVLKEGLMAGYRKRKENDYKGRFNDFGSVH